MAQTFEWSAGGNPPRYPVNAEGYYSGQGSGPGAHIMSTTVGTQGTGVVNVASAGLHNIESVPVMGSIVPDHAHMSNEPHAGSHPSVLGAPIAGGGLHSTNEGGFPHPISLETNKTHPVGWRSHEGSVDTHANRLAQQRANSKAQLEAKRLWSQDEVPTRVIEMFDTTSKDGSDAAACSVSCIAAAIIAGAVVYSLYTRR